MNLQDLRIDRTKKSRARRRRWPARVAWIAALLIVLFLLRNPLADLYDRVTLPEVEPYLVTKAAPSTAGAVRGKAANGYVVAARRAALSADFAGRIAQMNVREGSVVKAGDVVARLDSEEQAAAVRVAEAELDAAREAAHRATEERVAIGSDLTRLERQEASARAALDAAKARLARARAELARAEDLTGKGVTTRSALDDARAANDVAAADVRAAEAALAAAEAAVETGKSRKSVADVDVRIAKARVDSAGASLERVRAAEDKTRIRAPFDGIVVLKDAEVGEIVSPFSQGGSNARGSVVTMVDFASLEVQANVPETSLDAVRVGAPAEIFLDAWPDRPYAGRVDRIWPTADRQKGTIEVRVVFQAPDERLRPDLGVRVVFLPPDAEASTPADTGGPRILVPEAALVRRDGRDAVFVLEGDTVKVRAVETGARQGGRVEVLEGLTDGERIVAAPPASLADGDRVRVR